eukprot:Mrub_04842.p1 GENE.Mrub_04842~~Mrub_04842.p1  ORF type:complete len:369 (+),score=30.57 Mrub_04842:90-1196(+)
MNQPVYSYDYVPDNSGYAQINTYARNVQTDLGNNNTMSSDQFKNKFRTKKDAHFYFERILFKVMPGINYLNLYHYMLFYTGKVKLMSLNQLKGDNVTNIIGISDHNTVYSYIMNNDEWINYVPYLPVIENGTVVKKYLKVPWNYCVKLLLSLDNHWSNNIYLPAYRRMLNLSDEPSAMITVTEEVNQNLHLMPSSTGRNSGGSAMLRFAQLETLMEGSDDYRANLINTNQNTNNATLPTLISANHYVNTGNIQLRTNNYQNLSREELINLLIQNQANNNNNNNNNNNVQNQIFEAKLQTLYFSLAQLNFQNPAQLNLENCTIAQLNDLETMINNSVNQYQQLVLNQEQYNECNNYVCELIRQAFNLNN